MSAKEPSCLTQLPAAPPQHRTKSREPERSSQVLVTGERDPTAIYTAMRKVESMAGRSVVTQMSSEIAQLSSQIETVGSRLEAGLDSVDKRFDSIDRHLRLVWSFLFTLLAMLVALLLRT